MRVEIKKFGDMLISRAAGREALLAAKAYVLPKDKNEQIEIDFAGVRVLTPSWGDEFVARLKEEYSDVVFLNTENPSVKSVLKFLKLL